MKFCLIYRKRLYKKGLTRRTIKIKRISLWSIVFSIIIIVLEVNLGYFVVIFEGIGGKTSYYLGVTGIYEVAGKGVERVERGWKKGRVDAFEDELERGKFGLVLRENSEK